MPRPMTPAHTRAVAASWAGATSPIPLTARVSTATTAPLELQMGEEMESSIYRRPM